MYLLPACSPACSPALLGLVAAFLASRNKPSVDKQLFDDGAGFKRRSGVRRRNVMGASRQVRGQHAARRRLQLQLHTNLAAAEPARKRVHGPG
jgi:hypothetical protein